MPRTSGNAMAFEPSVAVFDEGLAEIVPYRLTSPGNPGMSGGG